MHRSAKQIVTLVIALAVLAAGCATTPEAGDSSSGAPSKASEPSGPPPLDRLIAELANDLASELPDAGVSTLAVSFFTDGGSDPAVSPFSDYVAEGLTTEIAAASAQGLSVVSRRAVEQVLSEIEFQSSDLVDDQTQVRLGRLSGADAILAGSIIQAEGERYVINAQVIQVATAVVLWGARADFQGGVDLAALSNSPITIAEQETLRMSAGSLELTIVETFDDQRLRVAPTTEEAFWGPLFERASGVAVPVARGSGAALRYEYEVRFSQPYDPISFSDTGGYVTLSLVLPAPPPGSHGVTFELNPHLANLIEVDLRGEAGWPVGITVAPQQWRRISLPFSLLHDESVGSGRELELLINVPYDGNIAARAFTTDARLSGMIDIDNVGYYSRTQATAPTQVAEFESGELDAAASVSLYESFSYVDYTVSDGGELKVTKGVTDLELSADHTEGLQGDGLQIAALAQLDPSLSDYVEAGRAFVLSANIAVSIPAGSQTTLAFDVSSRDISAGDLDLNIGSGYSAYADFAVSPFWSTVEVEIPQDREQPQVAVIYLRLLLSNDQMQDALAGGMLEVSAIVDRFRVN